MIYPKHPGNYYMMANGQDITGPHGICRVSNEGVRICHCSPFSGRLFYVRAGDFDNFDFWDRLFSDLEKAKE